MKNLCRIRSSFLAVCVVLAGCAGTGNGGYDADYDMPTVEYVERLNVNDAPHQESFLNQLAMNYRSYALYNARTSGYPEIAELFAQKAVGAFSGETPYPETLDNWPIRSEGERFEIYTAYNDLIDELKDDAAMSQPQLAAEAQAKFDCWISAASSGQNNTAAECERRFKNTLQTLRECDNGRIVSPTHVESEVIMPEPEKPVEEKYYPETRRLSAMSGASRSRDGVVIVNNVNVPPALVQPMPVPVVAPQKQEPMVFNQNIYSKTENVESTKPCEKCSKCSAGNNTCGGCQKCQKERRERDGYVSREEFIAIMGDLRAELAAINARLDGAPEPAPVNVPVSVNVSTPPAQGTTPTPVEEKTEPADESSKRNPIIIAMPSKQPPIIVNHTTPAPRNEKTIIKVQQIPLEPQQRIMEEIFEIRFDFDKAIIRPEYDNVIQQLAATTQANKNVKVSVVGHTDTAGSAAYNYALGGRRAEAVQKMLIENGIPASQIIAVSAGEEDLKVPTPNNTPNAENRRVRVVKEVQYTEQPKQEPIIVEKYEEVNDCQECYDEEE